MINGKGFIFFPNKACFYGNFKKNKLDGPGLLNYFSGEIVCGYWKNSKLHGLVFDYDQINDRWSQSEYNLGVLKKRNLEDSDEGMNYLMFVL